MKLFVFEPYEWAYCGGAIVVIAKDYEEAINLIISFNPSDELLYEYFSKNRNNFKKGHYDQWILTNTIDMSDSFDSKIIVYNWNYA